jgi:hypothetical protein
MDYLPALMQETASPSMSSRYVHVNTSDVINVMNDAGFTVHEQRVDKARKSPLEFQRHMVVFRNDSVQTPDGSYVPQMLWINSHNGKSPAVMKLGIYRFVCTNGMVVGNDFATERVRHAGELAKEVLDRVRNLSAKSVKVFDQIDAWSKIDLSQAQRDEFARRAAVIRFGEAKLQQYNHLDLLNVRRTEDDKGDMWSVFNRVQENAVKGGMIGRNANNRQVRSKSLNSIGLDVNFNEKLWELADEFVAA